MRMIDADIAQKIADEELPLIDAGIVQHILSHTPTINAVPVKRGKWEDCDWVEYDGHGECIHCPHKGLVCTNCRNAFKREFVNNPRVNYCPNCGARMDGE